MLIYKSLSNTLKIGIPLNKSLILLYESEKNHKIKKTFKQLLDHLYEGKHLCQSMALSLDKHFPKNLQYIETVPNIQKLCIKLHELLKEKYEYKKNILKNLKYPLLLLCSIVITSTLVITSLIPKSIHFFINNNIELPPLLQIFQTSKESSMYKKLSILIYISPIVYIITLIFQKKFKQHSQPPIELLWQIGLLLENGLSIKKILSHIHLPTRQNKWQTTKQNILKTGNVSHELSKLYQLSSLEKNMLLYSETHQQLGESCLELYQKLRDKKKEKIETAIKILQPCCLLVLSSLILLLMYCTLLPIIGGLTQLKL